MGKRKAPGRQFKITIREDLAKKLDVLLEDPLQPDRMQYGAMRKYLEKLIAKDMHERKAMSAETLDKMLDEIEAYYGS